MVDRVPNDHGGKLRVELTEEDIEKIKLYASWGATQVEVANALGIHVKTLQEKFNDLFKQGFAECQLSIRRGQVREANAGNATLLIWLGKQMLGQRDFKDTEEQIKAAIEQAIATALANKESKDE